MNAESVRYNSPGQSAQRDGPGTPRYPVGFRTRRLLPKALPWAIMFHVVGVKFTALLLSFLSKDNKMSTTISLINMKGGVGKTTSRLTWLGTALGKLT